MRSRRPPIAVLTAALVVALALAVATVAPAVAAAVEADHPTAVAYRPPVDAPLVDTFRPPATPYGPGNRGVDYATTEGQPIGAAAAGEVVFAGRIGATHHVTVLHDDGIRTSYSFLATTSVRRGQRVAQGQEVGAASAAPALHVGARAGNDAYLDPLVLFGQAARQAPQAWLVDDPDPSRPLTEAQERHLLVHALRGLASAATDAALEVKDRTAAAVQRKVDLARILADDAIDLGIPVPVHLALAAHRWRLEQRQQPPRCTDPATPPPPRPPDHRRIALLVGGLGSATGAAAVLDVDTTALGYASGDVHQFSYVDGGPKAPYGPGDTQGDIGDQGRRLADAIAALKQRNPGTPVDVIAHSQGGLVARSAITTHHAAPATVVTLGTPHQGTDLATAGTGLDATTTGHLLLDAATAAASPTTGLDLNSTSIQQMAETSPFITALPEHGWDPAATHVVSIAARSDPVVPSHQARIHSDDAYSTVVSPHGEDRPDAHATLPGSPEATVEVARALARQPPTCRTLDDALLDTFISRHTSNTHDQIGAALTAAGLYADVRTKQVLGAGRNR